MFLPVGSDSPLPRRVAMYSRQMPLLDLTEDERAELVLRDAIDGSGAFWRRSTRPPRSQRSRRIRLKAERRA